MVDIELMETSLMLSSDGTMTDESVTTTAGMIVSYKDVSYSVTVRQGGIACFGEKAWKTVLSSVSGVMKPGLNAILGRSGSGKTTLLDILAGRRNYNQFLGHVLTNGRLLSEQSKNEVGYVDQNDVGLLGALTVRENIHFSAALRLPGKMGKEEKRKMVEMVLADLDLTAVADSYVGNQMIRGISGGERKRTSIGMELVISPTVLYLDEPTTGLDAFTAVTVVRLLKELYLKKGNTIIFSIHQPRYSLFKMFDSITLLEKGHCVYHGSMNHSIEYFKQLGFTCEEHDNPADFFMDVMQTVNEREEGDNKEDSEFSLVSSYQSSSFFKATQAELTLQLATQRSTEVVTPDQTKYPTSYLSQLVILSQRTLLSTFRHPATTVVRIIANTLISLVMGMLLFQVNNTPVEGIQNRVGYIFFASAFIVVSNQQSVGWFIDKRIMFLHESRGGYYRVSAYFISQVLCDIIPQRLIPILPMLVVTYWMMGLGKTAGQFFYLMFTLILASCSASSLVVLYSALMSSTMLINLAVNLSFFSMTMFGGLLINLKSMPDYLKWIKYISVVRYSIECLSINEFHGMTFCPIKGHESICDNRSVSGDDYLNEQGFHLDNKWNNLVILVAIFLTLLVLSYARLRHMVKIS
ncbi:broad substrate specificity ATP-binding cassette transporter ABCG2-like [Corticium candelabrum]|uniref:broad substrate specificity ATP-binding cassette transporter ABCG2-like n=1 Tax=Corticium candelabrum TaxID=121492 RepID=UPI002E25A9D9|nr:broad substrate specificity ATP-binding cassette transporter ABCG2-like [Corticium candelabrum]